MTTGTVSSALPSLPTSEHWADRAVCSVAYRGFHDDNHTPAWTDPHLCGQLARLVEEVGEYYDARRLRQRSQMLSELADIKIVCAQIAWLRGVDLSVIERKRMKIRSGESFAGIVGRLSRALRQDDENGIRRYLTILCMLADEIAHQHAVDLEEILLVKLRTDEAERGYRHEGEL